MQTGDLFDGRYSILKVLGQGGMGTVYLAKNMNTETLWAIKEIHKKEDVPVDWLAEPKLLKKLDHPALPRLFDIIEQDGKLYMVSDYIEGISLDKKLDDEKEIPEEIVADWAVQLCKALAYLHTLDPNPIIYRDMKPSNIILTGNGTLKLIDFGIAREYKSASAGDTVYIGTRGYAAPEQYGNGQTSAASDIYSLGVTMHHLLTGKNPMEIPFNLKPVRYYDPSISKDMEAIVEKCTREDASERYQSASALLMELEGYLNRICRMSEEQHNILGSHCNKNGEGSFSKLVITVWDNTEFGCELAYTAAKHSKGEVLLADLDLLSPKADLILNLKKYPSNSRSKGIFGYSCLDMVMDAIGKGMLTTELLKQTTIVGKMLKNLHIITGNYRLENYEYYSESSVSQLIDKCYRSFDITILLVNRSIYDAFTLAALLKSDLNIAAIPGDVSSLREFNTYIAFLKEKQQLPLERTKFVLFEYDNVLSIPISEARAATQGNLLGKVSASRKRAMYRNLNGVYAERMENAIEGEYIQLLAEMGLRHMQRPAFKLVKRIKGVLGRENHACC